MSTNLQKLMARHESNKSKYSNGDKKNKDKFEFLDLRRDLPDGETTLRVIPAAGNDPRDTFIFRGKHRGLKPPNKWKLKEDPNAEDGPLTCNVIFFEKDDPDAYCLACNLCDKLSDESDTDLREMAKFHEPIPVVYFNAVIVGDPEQKVYVATTTNKDIINTIDGWIDNSGQGKDFEHYEYMHPKLGKTLKIHKESKERKDGKVTVDLNIQVSQKVLPLSTELLEKHQGIDKILKQVPDEEVHGYLADKYPDFVDG